MNPVTSLWYGVDPLAEKYTTTGGYVYTFDNPIKLIDPDGQDDRHGYTYRLPYHRYK